MDIENESVFQEVSDESVDNGESVGNDESIDNNESNDNDESANNDVITDNNVSDDINEPEIIEPDISDITSDNTSDDVSTDTSGDNEPTQEITYKYRDAVVGDEWGSLSVENALTIIGVENASEDGVYVIPDTIDGKKVIAIAQFAFSDESIKDTVKVVIVPESVKNIHNYAFSGCCNMTDIYLCGEAVAGSPLLFLPEVEERNETITLHASATCHDRNLRTYKSIYSYEEWAGHSIGIFDEWNGWE